MSQQYAGDEYLLTASALVFIQNIDGTNYYVGVQIGGQGWRLVDYRTTAPEDVVNACLATIGAGARIVLADDNFVLTDAAIAFTANQQVLDGQGRSSLIDATAVAVGRNAIQLTGFDDCIVRNLAINTKGATGAAECIDVYNGADRFIIERVTFVDSDSNSINIHGTAINTGWIIDCNFILADQTCISVDTGIETGHWMEYLNIVGNRFIGGSWAIYAQDGLRYGLIADNRGTSNLTSFYYSGTDASWNIISNNYMDGGQNLVDDSGDHTIVIGNHCQNVDYLYEGYGNYPMVIGNQGYNFAIYGISFESGTGYGIIADNWIQRVKYYGIYTSGPDRNIITGNHVLDCSFDDNNTYESIQIDSDRNIVNDNYVSAPTGPNRPSYCIVNYGDRNTFFGNRMEDGQTGLFNDGGTNTVLPHSFMEVNDPDTTKGAHPAILLQDGFNTKLNIQWLAPMEFQELVRAQAVVVADGSGNMDYWAFTNFGKMCADESYIAHEGTVAETVAAVTQNELECINLAGALANVALGDLVGIEFGRGGAEAADTVNADVRYLGMRIQYV